MKQGIKIMWRGLFSCLGLATILFAGNLRAEEETPAPAPVPDKTIIDTRHDTSPAPDVKQGEVQETAPKEDTEKKKKQESLFHLETLNVRGTDANGNEQTLPDFDARNTLCIGGDPTTVFLFLGNARVSFNEGAIQLRAENAVVWQTTEHYVDEKGERRDRRNYEVYLEGDVMVFQQSQKFDPTPKPEMGTPIDRSVFTIDDLLDQVEDVDKKEREARRNVLLGERVYLNLGTRSGLISNKGAQSGGEQKTKILYYLEDRQLPLVIRAESIRISGGVALRARNGDFTNTSHPDAPLGLESRDMFYVDTGSKRQITFEHNRARAYVLKVPLPTLTKDLNERGFLVEKIQYGRNDQFGSYLKTVLNVQAEGLLDEDWIDYKVQSDYYEYRGPALGVYGNYHFGSHAGFFQVYHLWEQQESAYDTGRHLNDEDVSTGRTYRPNPIPSDRGQVLVRHRTKDLFRDSQLSLNYPFFRDVRLDYELYWASDKYFEAEFKPKQYFEDKDKENYIRFRKVHLGRDVYSLMFKYRVNDFQTETEYLPKLRAARTYGPLLERKTATSALAKNLGVNYAASVDVDNLQRRFAKQSQIMGFSGGHIQYAPHPDEYTLRGVQHIQQTASRTDLNLELNRPIMFAKSAKSGWGFLSPGEVPESGDIHIRPWVKPRLTYYNYESRVDPYDRRRWDADGNDRTELNNSGASENLNTGRMALTLGNDVYTNFSAVNDKVSINSEMLKVNHLRHQFQPGIGYLNTIYVSEDPNKLVYYDDVDNLDYYEAVRFSLRNWLETKTAKNTSRKLAEWTTWSDFFPNPARDNRRMARGYSGSDRFVITRQTNSYIKQTNADGTVTDVNVQEQLMGRSPAPFSFSPIRNELNFYPTENLTLGHESYFNGYNGYLEDSRTFMTHQVSRNLSYTLGYSTHEDQGTTSYYNRGPGYSVLQGPGTDNTFHIGDASVTRVLNKKYSINLYTRYDFEIDKNVHSGLSLTRNFPGWAMDIGYERNAGLLKTSEEHVYFVTVRPFGQNVWEGRAKGESRPYSPEKDY